MKKVFVLAVMMLMVMGISVEAEAGLEVIGTATYNSSEYNLIYDNDLAITWLDYSNAPNTWDNHMDWAAGINAEGVLIYKFNDGITMTWDDDWRLPTTVDGPAVWGSDGTTTIGYNITSSEMGALFYDGLDNKGYYAPDGTNPQPGWGLTSTGDFQNLQSSVYWSGTEYSVDSTNAWYLLFSHGGQGKGEKSYEGGYALAVRPGDIAVVPEPISYVLFLAGGAMLGIKRFRKKQRSV